MAVFNSTEVSDQSIALLAKDAKLEQVRLLTTQIDTDLGQPAEVPPATDTAISGLNGRLQRVAQNITALAAIFKVGGRLLVESIGVALPRKITIAGTTTSTTAAQVNLLTNDGSATDVRDYNSGELTVISTAVAGSYSIRCCAEPTFSAGVTLLQIFESTVQNANPISAAITPTAQTRRFGLNLSGINYIRVELATGAMGIQAIAVLSQLPFVPFQTNVQQATNGNLNTSVSGSLSTVSTVTTVTNVASANIANHSAATTDSGSSAITTTATSSNSTPAWGLSQCFSVVVTAVTGTSSTLNMIVQESPDAGTTWVDVYAFPTITATGTYTSPMVAQSGRLVRYQQNVGGTTPSFTRSITRFTSHVAAPIAGREFKQTDGVTSGTANTSSSMLAANAARKYLRIQNLSTANQIFISTKATAVLNQGIKLDPGQSVTFEGIGQVPTNALQVICSATSQQYSVLEI